MVFLDTNVLVHSWADGSSWQPQARRALAILQARDEPIWISRQVVRECLATLTRPQATAGPTPVGEAVERVQRVMQIANVADEGPEVTARLLELLTQVPVGGKQVHDANIVASMLVYQIPNLLTFNTADFVRFSSHITLLDWDELA